MPSAAAAALSCADRQAMALAQVSTTVWGDYVIVDPPDHPVQVGAGTDTYVGMGLRNRRAGSPTRSQETTRSSRLRNGASRCSATG